jgi:hypothetical protein
VARGPAGNCGRIYSGNTTVVSSVLRKLDKLSNENYRASSSWELWRRRKAESVPFGNPGAKTYQKLQRRVLHRGFNSERGTMGTMETVLSGNCGAALQNCRVGFH